MKYLSGISITCGVALSCLLQPVVFGAYGGGGGGSSITQSKSTLSRDVCPDGDNSASYYDGTCGTSTPTNFVTQSYNEQKTKEHAVANDLEKTEIDVWIIERKEQLQKEIMKDSEKAIDMPLKYRKIQFQVEKIITRWDALTPEVKHKRAVLLLKKINRLLETAKLSPKAFATIQYIQNRAIMMTTY